MEEEPGCSLEKRFSFKRSEDCIEEDLDHPKTKGFFFDRGRLKKTCTFTDSRIEIVDIEEGRIKKTFDVKEYFDDDTFKIECVTPLDIDPHKTTPPGLVPDRFIFPLLLVGCSYSAGGMLLVLATYVDNPVRIVKIPYKVTAICPITVENTTPTSPIVFPPSLHILSGTIAIGTQCGIVYLMELQRDTFLLAYQSLEPRDPLDLLIREFPDLDTTEKVEAAQDDLAAHIAIPLNAVSQHNGLFYIQLPNNKICMKRFQQEDVYVSALHVIEEANLLVVAYLLRKHCEIEGEVYVYKNVFQLWDLSRLEIIFTSGLWDACEVTHLSHQVASDDPYASLYLHVACRTIDDEYASPFMLLYDCRFEQKDTSESVARFSGFVECCKKFEWYMSTPELPHGRLLSLSKLPPGPEDKQIVSYLTTMYSAQSDSYRVLLYLFDLNQWFSAQMPDEYSARSGPRYTAQHDLTQVLDARSLPISIDIIQSPDNVFICKNPRIQFDSFYHPNAYSFRSNCLLESEIVCVSHLGVHEKLVKLMTHGRASCLLAPEQYFNFAVRLHLQPLFMEPLTVNHRLEEYSA
uniref:Protein ELYS n=1 Tax=Cacopsylla melanoneura TaxID=428564 RepID=A0A8D8W3T5_9HEMI